MNLDTCARLDRPRLDQLFETLRDDGWDVVGPTVRDEAIVYDRIGSPSDLPVGWTDRQEAGTYRLQRRDDETCFGFVVGPHSWKRELFPPRIRLWSAQRTADGFQVEEDDGPPPRLALIGVRACELAAIGIQDRVFQRGEHRDTDYSRRRQNVFLVAVNCTEAGGTCFCASMDTGPAARSGHDLALTEVLDGDDHYFVVQAGTERGGEVLSRLSTRPAADDELTRARDGVQHAAERMGRRMSTDGLHEALRGSWDHPRWQDVAERCLSCANCTMVCPTCFCHNVEDVVDLTGDHAERWREWDSCFNGDHSYIHGGKIRKSTRSRYRQWLTHKLGTWHDQFDTSGCVGCGRCITWCPVGIDITEEVRALRGEDREEAPR